ncbi:MAG: hypothetical protein WD716_11830 [Fimbriimonadaceae bacterium]
MTLRNSPPDGSARPWANMNFAASTNSAGIVVSGGVQGRDSISSIRFAIGSGGT